MADLALKSRFYANVYRGLRAGQKASSGLKISSVWPILIVGSEEGLRCADFARITNQKQNSAYTTLYRVIKGGWLVKSSLGYYLSDKGRAAYEAVMNEVDSYERAKAEEITNAALKDIKRIRARAERKAKSAQPAAVSIAAERITSPTLPANPAQL